MHELRLAFRRLRKHPAGAIASIAALACAIGAAAATWSLLSAVLLRPLPVQDPEHLFIVGMPVTSGRAAGTLSTGFNYPYYAHVRDSRVFDRLAAVWDPPLRLLADVGGGPAYGSVSFVSHDYFDTLGLSVQAGRPFAAADDRQGAPPVAIVAERYWRRTWTSGEAVIGRTVTINHQAVSVIGIAPAGFRGLNLAQSPDFYLPFHTIAQVGGPPMNYFALPNVGMSPTSGVTLIGRSPLARAQVDARLAAAPPLSKNERGRLVASPINLEAIPPTARTGMTQFGRILTGTVILLLVAGCMTVGMLLLIRTEARRDEFAMCLALGASRVRLARGVAIEGALLSMSGALLALPVALGLFRAVRAFRLPGGVALDTLDLSLDLGVFVAAAAGSLMAMALITIIASLFGFRADVADAIRARAATTRSARRPTRTVLVAGQVAVALVLMAGAGVFTRTLQAALDLNAGFDPARLVTGGISLRPYGYDAVRARGFFDELNDRVRGNPSIASFSFFVQQGGMSGAMPIDGIPRQFPTDIPFTAIDERYLSTIGMRLVAGRDFGAGDNANAPLVGIVSESFARLLAGERTAIGRRITMPFNRPGQPSPQVEVVGVVPDVISRVSVIEPLVLYLPLAQQGPTDSRSLVVRTASDSAGAIREITAAVRQIDPAIVPPVLATMQDTLARQMTAQQFGAVVLGALGGIAVLLTLVGMYVLAESMAVMRRREMGIRAALGATRAQLMAIVLAEAARLVGLGLVAGLFLAWLGASTIRSFMFRVQPLDPLTLVAVSSAILILSLTVTLRPALRASHLDLAAVLKSE